TAGLNARRAGISVLGLSWALELVRVFYAGPRLMGYGLLLLFVGCAPKAAASLRWVAYGAASLLASVLSVVLVEKIGAGHQQYARMVEDIEPFIDATKPLYTNSLGLVDVHAGRRSIPVNDLPLPLAASCFLHVKLPNFDAVGPKVWAMPVP